MWGCDPGSPIMFLPILFHGDVGGTREVYVMGLGKESLSGSASSVMMRRRSLWTRLAGRASEEGGVRPLRSPPRGDGDGFVARILARVFACADELRLMEVEREEVCQHGQCRLGLGFRCKKMHLAPWFFPSMEQIRVKGLGFRNLV